MDEDEQDLVVLDELAQALGEGLGYAGVLDATAVKSAQGVDEHHRWLEHVNLSIEQGPLLLAVEVAGKGLINAADVVGEPGFAIGVGEAGQLLDIALEAVLPKFLQGEEHNPGVGGMKGSPEVLIGLSGEAEGKAFAKGGFARLGWAYHVAHCHGR